MTREEEHERKMKKLQLELDRWRETPEGKKKWNEFQNTISAFVDMWTKFENQYHERFNRIAPYMIKEGKITPETKWQFFLWLEREKGLDGWRFLNIDITWELFMEYHNYRHEKFKGTKTNQISVKGLAIFLFHRTGFDAPSKHDIEGWTEVLNEFGFSGIFTPGSIGKTYTDISHESNRINPKSDKDLQYAKTLFERFPDSSGLERLKAEITKQKKGTLPE